MCFPARKFFPITFLGSILWIAAFSYLMVWWATRTGETFGIPPEVSCSTKEIVKNQTNLSALLMFGRKY